MKKAAPVVLAAAVLGAAASVAQQQTKPLSPAGVAATQVGGTWSTPSGAPPQYPGGKWIEVAYGRPILRGRANIFGSGADYGKTVNAVAPVWRAGAGPTTKLRTEAPLVVGGKTLAPGEYDLFIDLKESGWTLVLGTQKTQASYDPKEKSAIWGSFGYDPAFDVARAPMTMLRLPYSVDQLTIGFVDVTDRGGELAFAWDRTAATADFAIAR